MEQLEFKLKMEQEKQNLEEGVNIEGRIWIKIIAVTKSGHGFGLICIKGNPSPVDISKGIINKYNLKAGDKIAYYPQVNENGYYLERNFSTEND